MSFAIPLPSFGLVRQCAVLYCHFMAINPIRGPWKGHLKKFDISFLYQSLSLDNSAAVKENLISKLSGNLPR